MFRFLSMVFILFLLYISWPTIEKQLAKHDYDASIEFVKTEVAAIKDQPEISQTIQSFKETLQHLIRQLHTQLGDLPQNQSKLKSTDEDKVQLTPPTKQVFSIHNVEIGETKSEIDAKLGTAKRVSQSEYGTAWYTYHDNYHNFFMIMYDQDNLVAGLYTNQDLIASTNGIKRGSAKETVRTVLGKPMTKIQKGLIVYQLQENADYDIFLLNDTYVTIFYDVHENNTVTAIQLINRDLELSKSDFYTKATADLKKGFEQQLFDLTNASRVNHQLPVLTWDEHVSETARDHSSDMAANDYFAHNNLSGESPFDRMKNDNILFHLAGENLAYGQLSSIFAHEGLINSLGHRENILRNGYEYLGVGVAFNQESQPYYTEDFYAK